MEGLAEKSYQQALHFLSYRPRSEREIRDFLLRKKTSEDLIAQVVGKLKQENLINDTEFVTWWLEQRADFNPRGKLALKQELLQKGIDKELIETELAKIKQEEYKNLARKVLSKKSNPDKQKLLALLIRRGFNYQTAREVIDEFGEKS